LSRGLFERREVETRMSEPHSHLKLLTLKEVCELTQFSMPTIRRMIARGDLPVVTNGRAGRAQRVRVTDLEAFLVNGGKTRSHVLKFPVQEKKTA
jgi:excisionase family DNA binding protein